MIYLRKVEEYKTISAGAVTRVSKQSILKMIMYLKAHNYNITAYKQIYGKKWIITYKRITTIFLNNKHCYNYLKPIFDTQQKIEYNNYLRRKIS